ncbi:ABC transporter ATP-binding protein [Saccharomonospora viridis]|jgi:ABC-2 type transport system ATP-binding protein|uniref:ABC-type multidrug transport system, ATPase component n=1 Tax=Saccharomonospora viridis (strain ATCC 15386 / DSM 43017 / JCM 3036 / CCUG 5913 / NBRC 12207 / NCIMB 9602 / P101) TaxID=471857 RepID=C7MX29_SACVD|nr:ATP-binding cassette domain-containing protein [Saccharomonospora viridis]ACU97946.1 ABC-type multidrug transport system, ATPase component [Saccharomonospora viridis DSM 43017]SFP39575.1 ABC-2 type transport system ATP-binding protein [Saccharomonospora viridis]
MTAALSCENLVKRYGDKTVVDHVGFRIDPGEAYGLLGPNGAGKTTTISMIVGLLRPDAGSVRVNGIDVAEDPVAAKRLVGYVPQEIALYPELSARENLRYFGRLYGIPRRRLTERIEEVLEAVGLTERGDDKVQTYSGGMKRRTNIGVALLHEPKLLILDEPTVGVDPQSRAAILDNVEQLVGDGMSLLYTSHYMEEVERVCTRVGIIDKGRVVADGTKRELVSELGGTDTVELVLDGDVEAAAEKLRVVEGVTEAVVTGQSSVRLLAVGGRHLLPGLLAAVSGVAQVTAVEVIEPDLEAAFLHLTGSTLRD